MVEFEDNPPNQVPLANLPLWEVSATAGIGGTSHWLRRHLPTPSLPSSRQTSRRRPQSLETSPIRPCCSRRRHFINQPPPPPSIQVIYACAANPRVQATLPLHAIDPCKVDILSRSPSVAMVVTSPSRQPSFIFAAGIDALIGNAPTRLLALAAGEAIPNPVSD